MEPVPPPIPTTCTDDNDATVMLYLYAWWRGSHTGLLRVKRSKYGETVRLTCGGGGLECLYEKTGHTRHLVPHLDAPWRANTSIA
jgi:hypothetical protein